MKKYKIFLPFFLLSISLNLFSQNTQNINDESVLKYIHELKFDSAQTFNNELNKNKPVNKFFNNSLNEFWKYIVNVEHLQPDNKFHLFTDSCISSIENIKFNDSLKAYQFHLNTSLAFKSIVHHLNKENKEGTKYFKKLQSNLLKDKNLPNTLKWIADNQFGLKGQYYNEFYNKSIPDTLKNQIFNLTLYSLLVQKFDSSYSKSPIDVSNLESKSMLISFLNDNYILNIEAIFLFNISTRNICSDNFTKLNYAIASKVSLQYPNNIYWTLNLAIYSYRIGNFKEIKKACFSYINSIESNLAHNNYGLRMCYFYLTSLSFLNNNNIELDIDYYSKCVYYSEQTNLLHGYYVFSLDKLFTMFLNNKKYNEALVCINKLKLLNINKELKDEYDILKLNYKREKQIRKLLNQ